MSKAFTVGRGTAADIRIPKIHDAVGKMHLTIEETGNGMVKVTDLQSTNGTFVRAGSKWQEITDSLVLPIDAGIMLGDYQTTPRQILAAAKTLPLKTGETDPKYRSSKDEEDTPPTPPAARRRGPRRNEFGEIVHE